MRNVRREIPQNLTGSLLVAHPSLLDPNFRRTVLFISAHDPEDGAIGVILNRPLDKQVADLVRDDAPASLSNVPVYLGGPVAKDQLMFAVVEWQENNGLKLNHNVGLDEANELMGHDPQAIRAFVGYAGWGAGQLEAEMKQNAWLVHKLTAQSLQPDRLPTVWFDIMRSLGPWYKFLAAAPDDPSLN
jgi:putative transcriptional regulator